MQAPSIQYPITVQAIRSKGCNPRLYVYVPLPLAAAIGLAPGEQVQWTLLDRATLQMQRATSAAALPPPTSKAARSKKQPLAKSKNPPAHA